MNVALLKTVGQVAGIGGIALGVLLLVFRDIIRKKIFPMLTKDHAYKLLRLVLLLVWLVALAGIGAWVWVSTHQVIGNHSMNPPSSAFSGRLLLDETRSSWITADSEFLDRFVRPPLRKDIESYCPRTDQQILVAGLWVGDIFAGIKDPLARMKLERDVLKIVPRLAGLKNIYQQQGATVRTQQMDAAWLVIPDKRGLESDIEAFHKFMRFLYPDPVRLEEAGVMRLRDHLVDFIAESWEIPETNSSDEASLRARLLYDIVLWRTRPVFRLRLNNPTDGKVTVGELVLLVDAFLPMADTGVSGSVQELAAVHVILNGNKIDRIVKPLNVAIAHKDAADIRVVFESTAKGVYQVRILLKDGDRILWETNPFNLFFTS